MPQNFLLSYISHKVYITALASFFVKTKMASKNKVTVSFPDGKKKEYDSGVVAAEIVKELPQKLQEKAIAAKISGKVTDLSAKITTDATFTVLTYDDKEGKEIFKHSAAHVLAMAVKKLFPKAKLTIGPSVEDGFYYDFDVEQNFTKDDLAKIEEEMKKIVDKKIVFERLDVGRNKAKELQSDEPYKLEMIDELGDDTCTMYKNDDFLDLCRGPHVPHTGKIKAFKLTKIAGAYWRGDAKNKQLQRIYGVAFPTSDELKAYLTLLEEAEKRDHRKLGKALDLFSFHDEGPGFPFFHSKGTFIWNSLVTFMRSEMMKRGYEENRTPMILNKSLWLQSGHWDHYKENMYFTKIDGNDYAVKPMNCPGNLLVYKTKVHSYKELPLKAGEFGLVHRHEMSGVLSGLFRVRVFTQDDAHIFCMEEQLEEEIISLIDFIDHIYKSFGFSYAVELSTRPQKAMGSKEIWDKAEGALEKALKKKKMDFKINPGDGAFYGPKIDYHLKDTLGRTWQCGTIQVDFSMPEKFDLEYDGKDGRKHRPVMVHRAIYGSVERFLGILIEHFAGKFPMWLSPVQVKVLTVADRFNDYALKVMEKMQDAGLRAEFDDRAESVSKKVRDAQMQKINYILVIGEKEEADGTVTIRRRDNKIIGTKKLDEFITEAEAESSSRRISDY